MTPDNIYKIEAAEEHGRFVKYVLAPSPSAAADCFLQSHPGAAIYQIFLVATHGDILRVLHSSTVREAYRLLNKEEERQQVLRELEVFCCDSDLKQGNADCMSELGKADKMDAQRQAIRHARSFLVSLGDQT